MGWYYLCRWHFYWVRLRGDEIGWGDVWDEDVGTKGFHCDWGKCKRKPYKEIFPWKSIYIDEMRKVKTFE